MALDGAIITSSEASFSSVDRRNSARRIANESAPLSDREDQRKRSREESGITWQTVFFVLPHLIAIPVVLAKRLTIICFLD